MTSMTRACLPAIVLCGTLLLACGETEVTPPPDAGVLPPQGAVPSCNDGKANGTESDVDCGGTCPNRCIPEKTCHDDGDCESAVCRTARCQTPTCDDGVKNGTESDADCGGGTGCAKCSVGKGCGVAGDCESGVCLAGQCAAASCTDGVKNQSETGIDCGGSCQQKCAVGAGCAEPTDCLSNVCMGNVCAAASCTDGVKNGTESDIDCGGGGCPLCSAGRTCTMAQSCESNVCQNGQCQAPNCNDGVKNGSETGTDCGGNCAAKCPPGQGCAGPSDCVSRVCTGGVCQAPLCTDGVLNGTESDIDCGGSCPQKCGFNQTCGSPLDCVPGVNCAGGVCNGCGAGLGNCDNDNANGCETSVSNNLAHCGGCGVACSSQNITPSCSNGSCAGGTCAAGFSDCNSNKQSDGCETNTASSPQHCGGCGMACSGNNVAQNACSGGNCTGVCAAGFLNCDNNLRTNGCEVNGNTDAANCGGCGVSVNDNNACTTDSCVNGVVTNTPISGCGTASTCPHSACTTGVALNTQYCSYTGANNNCVANVCAQDPFCCTNTWDTLCRQAAMDPTICPTGLSSPNTSNFTCNCAHSFCQTGAASQPLVRSCDPCVKKVCEADPFCCNTDWDNFCVQAVPTQCNITCP